MKKPVFIRRNPDLIARMIEDTYIILDTSDSRLFELNKTASSIWDFLKRRNTIEAVTKKIELLYKVPPGGVKKDIESFIKSGIKNKLFLV